MIIDIDYFPGYAKMRCYETVFIDFFCDVVGRMKRDGVVVNVESQQMIVNR